MPALAKTIDGMVVFNLNRNFFIQKRLFFIYAAYWKKAIASHRQKYPLACNAAKSLGSELAKINVGDCNPLNVF